MTCDAFDARLDTLLEGRCSPGEWSEAEAHAAACPRCRRVFDAVSGRADTLDDAAHEALAAAVIAKTSGSIGACASARERIGDLVDGRLDTFDRELVEAHLARCAGCSALARAVAEQTALLPSFAALAPRTGIVRGVLAATSRRPVEPTATERIASWIARAAQRPRFSLEVAYVMTVLLLVVLGNPVDAFREARVRAQPRVSAVTGAVSWPLDEVRTAAAETMSRIERALAPKVKATPRASDTLSARVEALLGRWIVGPLQAIAALVTDWAGPLVDSLRRAVAAAPTEPVQPPAR
jgi:predicted anti-sigma-YlaC factor YlaD